jgi:uncharacterized membrane protein
VRTALVRGISARRRLGVSALIANLALAAASVVVSWAVVHTTYALKYARLYYLGTDGGVDFHAAPGPPTRTSRTWRSRSG